MIFEKKHDKTTITLINIIKSKQILRLNSQKFILKVKLIDYNNDI